MLGLTLPTSAEWLASVLNDPARVLIDHAHCEKKAATMAISLINRYPGRRELVEAMALLAQEEMEHFAQVTNKIYERGYELQRDTGDAYVQALHQLIGKQEPDRLVDTLLVSSIVEARSCERFKLLAESDVDEDLRSFYASLVESEAQHRTLFVRLARLYASRPTVDARLNELNALEGEIIYSLRGEAVMHG
jgi:tRNA-(ms[2]io[6]A)-hydroxylase